MKNLLLFTLFTTLLCVGTITANTTCGRNEEIAQCGSVCEPTCANPGPGICQAMCRSGCRCKDGYLRDGNTNQCVEQEDCTSQD